MSFKIIHENKVLQNMTYPKLIEPGTHYFLNQTLKQCKQQKYNLYNTIFNLTSAVLFIGSITIFLYIQYRNHNDIQVKQQKEYEKHEQYNKIVNIIQEHNYDKMKQKQNIITNLPTYTNETSHNPLLTTSFTNVREEYKDPSKYLDPNIKYLV